MKCPYHITRNVAGYCSVCGSFVCDECLSHHEGSAYCPKHYKPIVAQMKRDENSDEVRKRHGRHHLIVSYLDGTQAQGTCRSLNLRGTGFYLELEDDTGISQGESLRVQFEDVKYVANVKSYNGQYDKRQRYKEYTPGGSHIVVRLQDGEVVEGTTMQAYVPDNPRFYLIPADIHSNNINLLIERNGIDRVFEPQEYVEELKREKELRKTRKDATAHEDRGGAGEGEETVSDKSELSQEESMGDFYFGTHNYPGAVEQYRIAYQLNSRSPRLKKKVVVALINIGIQYIKTREYPKALLYMDQALAVDPSNPHAKKKAKQVRGCTTYYQ